MENKIKIYVPELIMVAISFILVIFLYSTGKNVTVVIDGEERNFTTYESTFDKALKNVNIEIYEKDKIDKDLSSKIAKKDRIDIKRAVNLKVIVDNKELNIKSAENNIGSMLNAENITLKPEDKVLPGIESELSEGMNVEVVRVETKVVTSTAPINFKTTIKKDNDLLKSKTKVLQAGKNGEKEITTSVVYENGKEVSRKIVKEVVTKKPTDKIVVQGTLSPMYASRGSSSQANSTSFTVKATAYWAVHGVGTTYTASGKKAVRNPDGYSTIAVDPRVIPLGTKLYVEGYGHAIAADTGTAIKGNFIDVFFDTYNEACNWGLKYVNVHIVQ
ncbi:G5 domain-containing protein [uncultured Clostridium sp.]|uniref:G5 domain-containing protein n=1 Tax=uncultured Clostridium sp. TaxID=59620 RepID=UPI0028EBAF34|nr:G5 domain-containing protein [uncultured Clostridium sp.]